MWNCRAKLSCLPEFGADWGRGEFCECGARDTFRHAAMEEVQGGDGDTFYTSQTFPLSLYSRVLGSDNLIC